MADHEQSSALEQVRQVLKPGRVYRRADLLAVSNSVDRHLQALVQAGDCQRQPKTDPLSRINANLKLTPQGYVGLAT